MSNPTPEDQASLVKDAIRSGRKLDAIKRYRQMTGLSLKASKDAVEDLEKQLRQEEAAAFTSRNPGSIPADQTQQIVQLLFAGHKIEAIKLYRAQVQVGLKEAKDAVVKLEAELRISSPGYFAQKQSRGCSFVALLIIATLGLSAATALLVR